MSIRLTFFSALVAALAAQTASGAEPGWYFGVSAGSISADISLAQFDDARDSALFISGMGAVTGTSSADDSTNAWSVLGGYSVSPNLSVEAAYVDLGKLTYRYRGDVIFGQFPPRAPPVLPPTFYAAESQIEWDNSAVTVKLIGRLPLAERFDIHAQIGAAVVMTEVTSLTTVAETPPADYAVDNDANTTNLIYGVGAAFRFADRWAVSLDWQRYDVGEDSETPLDIEASYDAITLALLFRLGAAN